MSSFERVGGNDPTVSAGEDSGFTTGEHRPDLGRGTEVGRYIVIDVIGRGGMGVVYAAHDPTLDRRVALKLLNQSHDPDAVERLVREAQALAKLSDPHVVTVYDAGEHEDQVFIAMQLVDGEDLSAALANRAPTGPQVVAWFHEAGLGLAAAHDAGLVHRDFKPSNVLIDRRGHVAVTDFGLARSAVPDQERRTALGTMVGTPAYMSPEQHGMQPATTASDQFSFCVSLWEALLGQHPYIQGSREALSPFAIGYAIYDGELIAPPRSRVPRRVIDALKRGLARDPAQRWPSMRALLAALVPPPKQRRWPLVAAGLVVAGGAVAATYAFVGRGPSVEETCAKGAQERTWGVWGPGAAAQIAQKFTETKRSYAAAAARTFADGVEHYSSQWRTLAADACRAGSDSAELRARRAACLDSRLDSVRVLVGLVTGEPRPEFVDRAQAMVDGLPALAVCGDAVGLMAEPGAPSAAIAAKVKPIEHDLAVATARGNGGDYEKARADLTEIAARADAASWPPLAARAHLQLGIQTLSMLEPARDELAKASELALANHLDREAAKALSAEVQAAGFDRQPEVVAALVPVARAAAARVGDPILQIHADIAYGRALARMHKLKEAATVCRGALASARQRADGAGEIDTARDCILEALLPQGAYTDIEPMLAQMVAEATEKLGADHPRITDYMTMQLSIDLRKGRLPEARAKAERILAIRKTVYPEKHLKIAEALRSLGEVAQQEGKGDEAKQRYEAALAIAKGLTPPPTVMIGALHTSLGMMAQIGGDHPGAIAHFDEAIALARKRAGNESLEVAILLLNYGQIRAQDSLDQGIGLIGEAHDILERLGDKRADVAVAVLGQMELTNGHYADARKHFEEALAHVDSDTEPEHVGVIKYELAKCMLETKGDPQAARVLALEGRAILVKIGPGEAETIKHIDEWLAKHPARKGRR